MKLTVNTQALIPLIATIAYIPLLVIVLMNRPWQLKQKLFFLFLISAMLWSATDVFFRLVVSDSQVFFMQHKLILVSIVLCLAIWVIIQFRYLGQSFYKTEAAKRPFAYIILAASIALAALGRMPDGIGVVVENIPEPVDYPLWLETPSFPIEGLHVGYGGWMLLLVGSVLALGVKDIIQLIKRLKTSDNAAERNQIIYFFVAFGCLAILGFATLIITPGTYPVAHIGNALSAGVLLYTVLTHRLLDVRVVVRQAIIYVVLYGGSIGAMVLLFWLAQRFVGFQPGMTSFAIALALGIPFVLFVVYKVRDIWQRKVEEAFIGARSSSRRQLYQFIDETHPTLGQLGKQFISLLVESLDCRRACLLLPEPERGWFGARFAYPPVVDNPMAKLRLKSDSPVVTWLERENRILLERDLSILPEFRSIWKEESEETQLAGVVAYAPLMNNGRLVGILTVGERRDGKPYAVEDRDFLESIAASVAASVESAQLYARAEQRSRVDELTGLFNRRHFEERLKEEVARHSRYGDAFSVFMVDLDNFKAYNDLYGHPAGDVLLSQIGRVIKTSVRDADQAFRYGGDEFVVILPQTSRDDSRVVAERVRSHVAGEAEKESITVTCSIGLASYPLDGVIAGELVAAADNALYYAKWTGGNRIYPPSGVASEPQDNGRIRGKRNGLSAVYALVSVVESRDPFLYGHSRKVNAYAVALAEAIGLSPDAVSNISTAALLHDIGKIGIPDEVQNKKDKLSAENWEVIRAHPRLGANIVCNIPQLVQSSTSILHHHERWDGKGYPDGLKGEEIPVEARIIAIADAFEAMSSARAYRHAFSRQEVVEELRRCAGSHFDPDLVKVFIGIIQAGLPEKVKAGRDSTGQTTNP